VVDLVLDFFIEGVEGVQNILFRDTVPEELLTFFDAPQGLTLDIICFLAESGHCILKLFFISIKVLLEVTQSFVYLLKSPLFHKLRFFSELVSCKTLGYHFLKFTESIIGFGLELQIIDNV
jgi:hypothetical protein